MSDFVSFSTSDERYFKVDPQRLNNVDTMLKCCLGLSVLMIIKFGFFGHMEQTA